jgi:hypothetical protein
MDRYCNIDSILQLDLELSIERSIRRKKNTRVQKIWKVFLIELFGLCKIQPYKFTMKYQQ